MPPILLIRTAVALVWLYEGLVCKLLRPMPSQQQIVRAVPLPRVLAHALLPAIGIAEVGLGLWALSGRLPFACALTQTVILIAMNTVGILSARHLIHDPIGMVLKNFALLVLAWVAAGYRG